MENEIKILAVEKMMKIEVEEVKLETAETHSGSLEVEPITWRSAIKDDNNENIDKMILNRIKNEHNYVEAWIECHVSSEEFLKMEGKIIKLEKDLDCEKFEVNEITEEFIIKDENSSMDANSVLNRISSECDEIEDEGSFIPTVVAGKTKELVDQIERMNLEMLMNIKNCPAVDTSQFQTKSSAIAKFDVLFEGIKNEHNYVKDWIECHVSSEEFLEMEGRIIKSDKDLDCGKFEANEITEEFIIKNENDYDSSMDADSVLNRISSECDEIEDEGNFIPTVVAGKTKELVVQIERMNLEMFMNIKNCPAIDTPQVQTKSSAIAKLFKGGSKRKIPRRRHHKVWMCMHCDATYRQKRSLDEHTIGKHPDFISSVSSKIYECTHCTYQTVIKSQFARHMLKHPETAYKYKYRTCKQCDATLKTKEMLDEHTVREHPDFMAFVSRKIHECTHCMFKTTLKSNFAIHMLKHSKMGYSYKLSLRCMHCDVTFTTKPCLDEHTIRNHPDFIASVSSKIYKCTHCTYQTVVKTKFAGHMLKHPGTASSYNYSMCIHCDARYMRKHDLDEHTLKKHPDFIASVSRKIHKCTHCTYQTVFSTNFDRHMLKHPETAYKYKYRTCMQCDATLKSNKTLDEHIVRKHPDFMASVSRKIHECTHCMYKTTMKSHLAKHMLKHSKTGYSGYSYKLRTCMHCDALFRVKQDLDEHTLKKHPDFIASVSRKIHKCTRCTYQTVFNMNFDRHMLKHPETAYKYKYRTCMQCDATLKSNKTLDEHIVRKHPDFMASVSRKIHECTHCMYKTTMKSHLAKHMLKHSKT